jgi:hypothetical protein
MDVTKAPPSPDVASRLGAGPATASAQTSAATNAATAQNASTAATAAGDRVDIQPLDVAAALQILIAEVRAELPVLAAGSPSVTATSLPLNQSVGLALLEAPLAAPISPLEAELPPGPPTVGSAVPLMTVPDPKAPMAVLGAPDPSTVASRSAAELLSAEATAPGFLTLVGDPVAGTGAEITPSPSGAQATDWAATVPSQTPAATDTAGMVAGPGVNTDTNLGLESRSMGEPPPGTVSLPAMAPTPVMEPPPGVNLPPWMGSAPGVQSPPAGELSPNGEPLPSGDLRQTGQQPLMPPGPEADLLEPLSLTSGTRLTMPNALTLLSSPAQASPMVMRLFLRAVPDEADNAATFTQLEDTLLSALDRAVSAVEQWRDVPQVVVDAARETRALVMSQLADDATSLVWPRPEWLWLTPHLERYRRRRRLARRGLTDPDLRPVGDGERREEEKEKPRKEEP